MTDHQESPQEEIFYFDTKRSCKIVGSLEKEINSKIKEFERLQAQSKEKLATAMEVEGAPAQEGGSSEQSRHEIEL
jgi:hypothetical protein